MSSFFINVCKFRQFSYYKVSWVNYYFPGQRFSSFLDRILLNGTKLWHKKIRLHTSGSFIGICIICYFLKSLLLFSTKKMGNKNVKTSRARVKCLPPECLRWVSTWSPQCICGYSFHYRGNQFLISAHFSLGNDIFQIKIVSNLNWIYNWLIWGSQAVI